jgi:hypothetical protein
MANAPNGGFRFPWGIFTKEREAYEKALSLLENLRESSFPEVTTGWVSEAMWRHRWEARFGPLP